MEGTRKPKITTLMVFGPHSFGKSTFINNLLELSGSQPQAEVGDGSGEPVTLGVKCYSLDAIPQLFPNDVIGFDRIKIFDVPGLLDSGLPISKEELLLEIKKVLLDNRITHISGFLLFESVRNCSRKLNHTATNAIEIFGEALRESSIFLTTWWDHLRPREIERIEPVVQSMAQVLRIQTMRWENNCEDHLVSEQKMNSQLSELGDRILGLRSYIVEEMNQLLEEMNKLAKKLEVNDPDGFAQREELVDNEELEETIGQIKISETEWVPLTPEEIAAKANDFYINQVPIPGQRAPILSTVRKPITREILEYETKFHEYETGIIFKDKHTIPYQVLKCRKITGYYETTEIIGWEEKPSIKIPVSLFAQTLDGSMKPQQVEKIVNVKIINKKFGKKNSFGYYQKLAAEEIKKRIESSIRSKSYPQN